tara:strand:+ start:110 stop:235 length:126 start_codon:yes stop_codon:yes gene_type:complete
MKYKVIRERTYSLDGLFGNVKNKLDEFSNDAKQIVKKRQWK